MINFRYLSFVIQKVPGILGSRIKRVMHLGSRG